MPGDIKNLEAKIAELEKRINKLQDTNKKINVDNVKSLFDGVKQLKEAQTIREKISELSGEEGDRAASELKYAQDKLEFEQEYLKTLYEKVNAKEKLTPLEQRELAHLEKSVAKNTENFAIQKKGFEAREKAQEEYNEQVAKGGKLATNLGAMIGLQVKYSETLLGSITTQLDAITDNVDAQKEFARQMKETFKVSNMLGSVFDKVFESSVMVAKAFDSAVTSFNKATGAGGKYDQMIGDVGQSNKALGISMADAGAAAAALHAGFSDFTNLSDNMAQSLTTTAATLEKVGVDSGTFAQNLQFMTRTMGLSTKAAEDLSLELATIDIGISPQKLGADFAAAAPQLAQFGARAAEVFIDLEKQAKAAGVEMQSLLGVMDSLDTWESAATAAGKLAAVLGGPIVNAAELATASLEKKNEMLREGFLASGQSWGAMDRLERKQIAAIVTQGNVALAAGIFGAKQVEVTQGQKDLNEMVTKSIPIMEKMEGIMASFAVAVGPVVDIVSEAATGIAKLMDENKELIQILSGVILVVGGVAIAIKAVNAVMAVYQGGLLLVQGVSGSFAAAQAAIGSSSAAAAPGLTAVGGAAIFTGGAMAGLALVILAIGGAIALAAFGISMAADSIGAMADNGGILIGVVAAIVVGLYLLIPALGALGTVSGFVAGPLLAVGGAILMIGAGIGAAAAGIGFMVNSFANLAGTLKDAGSSMTDVLSGMGQIATALDPFQAVSEGIARACSLIATGVGELVLALSFVETEKLAALAELGTAISQTTADNSINFTASMKGMKDVIDAANSAGVEVVVKAAQLAQAVTPVNNAAATTGGAQSAASNFNYGNRNMSHASSNQPTTEVVLKIGEDKFASTIIKLVDQRLDLRLA
jgi:hypothetical protein